MYRGSSAVGVGKPLLDHPGPSAHSPLSFSLILWVLELVLVARISTNREACVIIAATVELVDRGINVLRKLIRIGDI